ncbi:DNA repair protein RecN [Leptospira sp. 2 VSF19]|uniref:DNA repair protein RecN n=1 Tax=Leptospira soteropolitanensis TaxID=2950025 RepID=A0AAW5VFA1_9LEPT|nr:DNA repair protein RecN [Leptospira soteropolitanensis]MCW7492252.1 DNA repair protein RecN [Leptospira soteropolitanensis]MCW7499834.1 DNA repair protein RecN [Leptospira soteropolitanensis]MCW7522085.1 DNA repair protein RecN [Leptospira soteropolitanensis]MCW7525939.1 DNA repair protein RecN [Leptospira soteropolitanensis]MCW7529947.1 DNA repair protein RecN [Leptospira soteropolitanensis]
MITHLKIKDFALFESLELSLSDGLTVFTGESGAGKSLIFDALASLFGGRCSTANIRQGKDRYSLQAVLSLAGQNLAKDYLMEQGFRYTGDEIVITKELMKDGKARVKIGESLASTSHLRELGKTMAEIHCQNEQLFLLEKSNQLEFLDRYGNLESLKFKFKSALQQYRHWKQKLIDFEETRRTMLKRKEILEYEIEEIESVSPKEGEDESLSTEESLLANGEKLAENYRLVLEELVEKENSILKVFPTLIHAIQKVSILVPEKKEMLEEWEEVYDRLKSLKSVIREEEEELFFSPERLDMVQSRLQDIKKLKKKYNVSLAEINLLLEEKKSELERWNEQAGDEDFLRIKKDQCLAELKDLGFQLSKLRRNVISQFEEDVQKEMADLGLEGGKLQVVLRWEENPEGEVEEGSKSYFLSESGLDQIEFYFSANPGEKPRPLRKVASGGELSRVMLALRSVLGKQAPSPQMLVLDEVDTGLGGEAAEAMATKLKKLARNSQILLITHTQQVAASGHHQIKIEKRQEGGRTVSIASILDFEERKRELARMIGGKQLTSAVLKAATDLLMKKAG